MNRERSRDQEKRKKVTFDDDVELDLVEEDNEIQSDKKKSSKKKKRESTSVTPEKTKAESQKKKGEKKKEVVERTWNDLKEADQEAIDKGPFTQEELASLQDSIVEYCLMNNLDEEALVELVSSSSGDKFKNAWIEISAVLPNRKVQSCHAVCKRKFNPNNYRGKWSEEEVDFLLDYVENKGREWEKVGKLLGRTALNVRDKFKELGEGNYATRIKAK